VQGIDAFFAVTLADVAPTAFVALMPSSDENADDVCLDMSLPEKNRTRF